MFALPSLTALRAFEVAARRGSFSLAAAELGVTPAAVSLQVKALEAELGRRLFLRQGNRILLTDAGRTMYPHLELAFRELSEAAGLVAMQQGRPVVSVLPMLAPWVLPQLAGQAEALELRIEDDPVALTKGAADLRVTYGGQLYPDHRVIALGHDRLVPVATKGAPAPQDAPATRFIHIDWGPGYGSLPGWAQWFAARGLPPPDPGAGWRVNAPALAVGLVLNGCGLALLPERAVPPESGLCILPGAGLPLPLPHVAVMLQARAHNQSLGRIVARLGG